jgi:hypothetical protein
LEEEEEKETDDPEANVVPVCHFWTGVRGSCIHGDNCQFRHDSGENFGRVVIFTLWGGVQRGKIIGKQGQTVYALRQEFPGVVFVVSDEEGDDDVTVTDRGAGPLVFEAAVERVEEIIQEKASSHKKQKARQKAFEQRERKRKKRRAKKRQIEAAADAALLAERARFESMGYSSDEWSSEDSCYRYRIESSDEEFGMFGFSGGDIEELASQGVKPWDDDAGDVLAALSGCY